MPPPPPTAVPSSLLPALGTPAKGGLALSGSAAVGGSGKSPASATGQPEDKLSAAAQAALKAGDTGAAITDLKGIIKLRPQDPVGHVDLALAYLQAKNVAGAAGELKTVTKLDPANAAAQYQYAQLLIQQKQYSDAEAPLRAAINLVPKNREAPAMLAQVLIQENKLAPAYELWAGLAKSDLNDVPAAMQAAALANDGLHKPAVAQKLLADCVAANPHDPRPAILLGRLDLNQKQPAQAVAVLKAATNNRPDVFELFPALAEADLAAGDGNGAVTALQSAIMRAPDPANPKLDAAGKDQVKSSVLSLHLDLGRLLQSLKKSPDADAEFAKAESMDPGDPQLLGAIVEADTDANDFPDAIDTLQKLSVVAPKDPRVVGEWAELLDAQKQLAAAAAKWKQVAALDPKNPAPLVKEGSDLRDTGDNPGALAAYNAALALTPNEPALLYEVAKLQSTTGDDASATATWKRLLQGNPEFAEGYPSLIKAADHSGKTEEARSFLAGVLANKPEDPMTLRALTAVLKYYDAARDTKDVKALLSEVVVKNPEARTAAQVLASLSGAKAAGTAEP